MVYPTLQLLDETGLLAGTEKDGRKTYTITATGRTELEANRETVRDFCDQQDDASWEAYADELGEFSRRLMGLVKTVHRGARHGRISATSMRQLRTIIDDTIARVGALLFTWTWPEEAAASPPRP